ncbi:MAG: hypothetical protein JNL67_09010 [Planctomycetaceae bacterium]|nr:hypothetical protein [Planctomycetaceae bacterium]
MRRYKIKRNFRAAWVWIGFSLFIANLAVTAGCQNRPFGSRLFNFGRTERVPPPPTNSLNIPQFAPVLGSTPYSLGAPAMAPANSYPTGSPTVGLGVSNQGVASPAIPGVGVSPWNTAPTGPLSQANPNLGTPTYSQIPDRGAPAAGQNSSVAINPTLGIDRANVPALLPGGFDPYDTSQIPSWSSTAATGFGSNPLASNSSPTTPPGAQEGFWPGQLQTPGSPNNSGFGSGQWLRRVFGGPQLQPANLTGYVTTAPIENPMIPVTAPIGYPGQSPGLGYPVQPVNYVAQPAGLPGNGLSYARWREMQEAAQAQARQQATWQQTQLMNQQMAQAAVLRSAPGAGNYQVLAENSTSRTAENQSRFGWAPPPQVSPNSNYGGPSVVNPTAQPLSGQAPPMFRSSGQPLRTSDNNGLQTGWQAGGVR